MEIMGKKGLRMIATGHAVPKKQISNEDLSKMVDTNDEWIRTRTGISNRYQCEEESCVSLAVEAAKKALEQSNVKAEEIGGVIVATSTPDYVLPSAACMVQKYLGLREEIMAFDLSAACTGFLYGLAVGFGLLQTMNIKYLLVIGSEQLSRIIDYTDRTTCILFGDGAGAAIISAGKKMYDQMFWARGEEEILNCPGIGIGKQKISMKGTDVFKFAVVAIKQGIDQILERNGKKIEDIDYVICHQANERIIRSVQKKYPGQEEKFYINIENYGNTSSASIPIALDELVETGKLKRGMLVVCVGFGAGLTWSSMLLEL